MAALRGKPGTVEIFALVALGAAVAGFVQGPTLLASSTPRLFSP